MACQGCTGHRERVRNSIFRVCPVLAWVGRKSNLHNLPHPMQKMKLLRVYIYIYVCYFSGVSNSYRWLPGRVATLHLQRGRYGGACPESVKLLALVLCRKCRIRRASRRALDTKQATNLPLSKRLETSNLNWCKVAGDDPPKPECSKKAVACFPSRL